MRYDVSAHRASLARLAEVPAQRQLFFALWCQESLWPHGGGFILDQLSPSDRAVLESAREALWREALGGPPAQCGSDVTRVLENVHFDEDDFTESARCAIALVGLLELTATGEEPLRAAVESGVDTIDRIFFHLQEVARDEDSPSSPLVLNELRRQIVMVDSLLGGAPTVAMRRVGRDGSLFAGEDDGE